jgi:hypothetical protein
MLVNERIRCMWSINIDDIDEDDLIYTKEKEIEI